MTEFLAIWYALIVIVCSMIGLGKHGVGTNKLGESSNNLVGYLCRRLGWYARCSLIKKKSKSLWLYIHRYCQYAEDFSMFTI